MATTTQAHGTVPRDHHASLGFSGLFAILKAVAGNWSADNISRMSAASAYYAVFSIAPLLAIAIAIAGFAFGEDAARNQISGEIQGWVGSQAAQTIQSAVAATGHATQAGIWTLTIGVVTLLLGASTFFSELKNSLNLIWGVKVRPGRAITTMVRAYALSFSMVLSVGFLLLVSLIVSAVLSGLNQWLSNRLALPNFVWPTIDAIISLTVISTLFALIFKVIPNVQLRWKDVWPGAIITAMLFTGGKLAIAWYLGRASVSSTFGAAGSIVVILLWMYYATSILFLGAEIIKACVLHYGQRIVPDSNGMLSNEPPPERVA